MASGEVDHVIAHTLPGPNPSTGVLVSLGFEHVADQEDPEVGTVWEWRWTRQRSVAAGPRREQNILLGGCVSVSTYRSLCSRLDQRLSYSSSSRAERSGARVETKTSARGASVSTRSLCSQLDHLFTSSA